MIQTEYMGQVGATRSNIMKKPMTSLTIFKLLENSVISTPGERFIDVNIKNVCIMATIDDPYYMSIPTKLILQDMIN